MTASDSHGAFRKRIESAPRIYDAAAADRLKEALGPRFAALDASAQELTLGVGGASPFLSRLITKAPDEFAALMNEAPEAYVSAIIDKTAAAGGLGETEAVMSALRAAKGEAALAIGLAEIAGVWNSLEAGAALSRFADAAIGSALRAALTTLGSKGFADADAPDCEKNAGIAVIAMGKLGACELNYSSDIDLVVLFDPSAPALGEPMAAREIAVSAARRLVRILNDQTAEGYVFRTDLRLRPDPGVSAAAVSARAAEAYYEAHGQNWERAAYIKARAAAGDMAVGEAFLDSLRPFVWRKYLDFAAIEDIHSIKRQIHASKGGATIEFHGHDIKTGRGGIREIEFLAQTQQLMLGGKNPALRQRATLDALAALNAADEVSDAALASLTENYHYLRRVEHRLQMINDEQTHKMPREDAGAERLAAFLGEADARAFEARLTGVLTATHGLFSDLFEREERLSSGAGSLSFTGVEDDPGTIETLTELGFARPGDVAATVRRWHTGALRATRSARARELLTKLAPRLLEALSGAGDPDAAFVAFDEFLRRLPAGVQVFSLFANNPEIFDLLIRIMTISPFLGRALSRRVHLIEALLESDWPDPAQSPDALAAELEAALADAEDYEDTLNAVRRWGAEEKFNAAAQLVTAKMQAGPAAAHFTATAEAAIRSLLPAAQGEMERAHGPIDGALVVMGLGRLGARAMTASSDIDLVFIYDAGEGAMSTGKKPLDAPTYFLRLVRRVITALSAVTEEGGLYDVDMQLRPSGSKGPWAVSFAAFERYYEGDAWTWEEMALTKARAIAGDEALAARMREALDKILVGPRDAAALAADVDDMRARLAEAKPAAGVWDVKRAEGGLTELEFILAYLSLRDGASAGPPPQGAGPTIEFLAEKGAIDSETAESLLTASELFETVIQVSRAATGDVFAPDLAGEALKTRMAASCGAETLAAAEKTLRDRQKVIKRLYDRIVAEAKGAANAKTAKVGGSGETIEHG